MSNDRTMPPNIADQWQPKTRGGHEVISVIEYDEYLIGS